MLEARLPEAATLKRVLDAVTGLITDANFDCTEDGINLQAMDNSHVALTVIELRKDGFDPYRCDRAITIGVSLASLSKIVKSGNNDDILTLRKQDVGDRLTLTFESARTDRLAEYDLKLMDIDSEVLGIPDSEYEASVSMSSQEFVRITRDLSNIGDSVKIDVQKKDITFTTEGEIGNAVLTLKQGSSSAQAGSSSKVRIAPDEDEEEADDDEEDDKPKKKAKRETAGSDDEDVKPSIDDEEEEEAPAKRKRGKQPAAGKKKASDALSGGEVPVTIDLRTPVKLTFSLKYLSNFSKAAPLAEKVTLKMNKEFPLLVEFAFEHGHISFYLAPKLGDDEDDE